MIQEILIAFLGLLAVPKKVKIDIADFYGKEKLLPETTITGRSLTENEDTIFKLNNMSEAISEMAKSYQEAASTVVSEEDLKRTEDLCYNTLLPRRMLHCLSCGEVLYRLHPSIGKANARVLALLHDIAHNYTREQLLSIIDREHLVLEKGERELTVLLHAPVGAFIARTMIPSLPDEFVNAIRRHTVPHPDMNSVSYALFVADIIEPTRPFITDSERQKIYDMQSDKKRILYSIRCQEKYLKSTGGKQLDCTLALVKKLEEEASRTL